MCVYTCVFILLHGNKPFLKSLFRGGTGFERGKDLLNGKPISDEKQYFTFKIIRRPLPTLKIHKTKGCVH